MNPLGRALALITAFLNERRIPYMVIGGVANLVWGEARATLDVDATVLVEEPQWPGLIEELRGSFRIIPKDPEEFLRDTHVLPIETGDGIRIDLIWARLPYEHAAIARATIEDVANQQVRVCRPEDLIIHKIISERPKDRDDVRNIIRHQGAHLDRQYLTRAVQELAKALDQPELLMFLTTCLDTHSRR